MAHGDMDYYQRQYRERLPALLRECGRELRATEEDSSSSFICVPKKMKEVKLMKKVVEETDEVFKERMETFAEQWRDLHGRREQLKARMMTSGTTVMENERLRSQALKKAKEYKEENSKKESELLRARRKLEALRNQLQKLSKKLQKYSIFKKYLEDVVENSQFQDIEDILTYYKDLVRTRKELLQSQRWHQQLVEHGKVLQQQISAEKEAKVLQCKNDLAQLRASFDQAQRDIRQWEGRWAEARDGAARKAVELKSLTMAIHSMFQAASPQLRHKGKVAAGNSHEQLDTILQCIHDLQDLTENMKEHSRAL